MKWLKSKEERMCKCKNCKHLGEIYFPPTTCQDAIHLKGCFYFADGHDGGKRVMYLGTIESLCECFEPKLAELKGAEE